MKILVTGRSGQVAKSLAERASAFPQIEICLAGRPILDLEHDESIRRAVETIAPDMIISAAAYTAVDQAEQDLARAERVNARAPGVLAEAARETGARLIHLSTDYVFDGRKDAPYQDDDPVAPINAYGRTKLAGEESVRAALAEHAIIRTAWVYSPFGKNFVKTMLALAERQDRLTIVEDQIGNPTSAIDLADGILAVIRCWQKNPHYGLGQTFHLAGGGAASWADFARHIFTVSAEVGGPAAEVVGISTDEWPTLAARPRNSRLDSARFEAVFGYAARPWPEAAAEVVRRIVT